MDRENGRTTGAGERAATTGGATDGGGVSLRAAEAEYRSLFEASGVAHAEVDLATGRFVRVNRRFAALTGYTEAELLGTTFLDITHPDDRDPNRAAIAALLDDRGDCFEIEKRYVRKDGTPIWVHLTVAPIRDDTGRATRLLGTATDVTERRRTETSLRAAHDTFQHLVERSPFGVYAVDAGFRLVQVSAGAQRVFENVRPLLGRDFAEVLRTVWPEPFATEAIGLFRRTLETGEPYHAPATVERRRDIGEVESYDWKIERLTMPDGRPGVVCHFYDLSERQRYEAALAGARRRLDSALIAGEVGTFEWDVPADRLRGDRNFARIFGIELGPDGGAPIAEYVARIHSDDRPAVLDRVTRTLEFGDDYEAEYRIVGDGRTRWVIARGKAERDASGHVVRFPGVVLDVTARKQAEEALAIQHARERAYLDHLPVGVWFLGPRGEIEYGNAAAQQVWAGARYIKPEEFGEYKGWWHATGARVAPEEWAAARAIREGATSLNEEIDIECFDGSRKTILNSAVPVRGPGGEVVGAAVFNQDITERKRQEQALREAVERYERQVRLFEGVASTTPDFVYVFDLEGRFRYANRRLLEVWGMRLPEIVGRTCRELGYEQWHHDMHMREIAQVIETKRPVKGEVPFEAPLTGVFGVYEYIFSPVIGPDGEVELIAGTTRDITERKRSEVAIREQFEPTRTITDNATTAIFMMDHEGRTTFMNPAAEAMTGFTFDELKGEVLHDKVHHTHADGRPFPIDECQIGRHVLNQRALRNHEDLFLRKDGTRVPVRCSASPIIKDGALSGVVLEAQDITDRRRTEEELRRYRAHLEQIVDERTRQLDESSKRLRDGERVASLGMLTAGLGHDLHNALLPLRVHVEELAEAARRDPAIGGNVSAIEAITGYLAGLSRGMRMLSKDPEQTGSAGATDLSEWEGNVRRVLASAAGQAVEFACRVEPGLPPVPVPDHRLTQAVFNLVQNAREAIVADRGERNGGRIELTVGPSPDGAGVVISVSDNGPGMDEATRRRCLEPFFTTKARGIGQAQGGTGLGLSLVGGIAAAAGGRVEVDSAPGRGATFRLHLPVARAEPGSAEEPAGSGGTPVRPLACVELRDARAAAFVSALLRAQGAELVARGDEAAERAGVWVTDGATADAACVLDLARGGRVVVVLGAPPGGTLPQAPNIVARPPGEPLSELRGVLAEAVASATGAGRR